MRHITRYYLLLFQVLFFSHVLQNVVIFFIFGQTVHGIHILAVCVHQCSLLDQHCTAMLTLSYHIILYHATYENTINAAKEYKDWIYLCSTMFCFCSQLNCGNRTRFSMKTNGGIWKYRMPFYWVHVNNDCNCWVNVFESPGVLSD